MDKIAVISSGYFPVPAVKGGAVETLIENLIDGNEKNKMVDLTIFSTFDIDALQEAKKYINSNFEFIRTPKVIKLFDKIIYYIFKNGLNVKKHMSFRYIFQRIYYIYAVAKKLKKNNFDKVVIENTSTLFWTIKLFGNKNKYKNKVYYHLHNEVGKTFGCKELISSSKKIIGVSEYINNSFKFKFINYPKEKMDILLNCIDLEKIRSTNTTCDIRKKYNIHKDDILYIFAGRLCEEKGIKQTIEAFSKLNLKNVKLMVVGNYYFGTDMKSDFEEELMRLSNPLRDKIIFTGYVQNSKLGAYYSIADIAVLPSMWNEPAGLTIIEAMSAGLPVITTEAGGIPEYTNEECSVLIRRDKNFVENLKNAMIELYNNEVKRKNMSSKSVIVSQNYSKEHYFEKFIGILNKD